MFQRAKFDQACTMVAAHYEKSAPTVEQWCDWLCTASGDKVTLADISLLMRLSNDLPQANYAANLLYKHLSDMNRDTTGQIGF